jgi:hypothetical protein
MLAGCCLLSHPKPVSDRPLTQRKETVAVPAKEVVILRVGTHICQLDSRIRLQCPQSDRLRTEVPRANTRTGKGHERNQTTDGEVSVNVERSPSAVRASSQEVPNCDQAERLARIR